MLLFLLVLLLLVLLPLPPQLLLLLLRPAFIHLQLVHLALLMRLLLVLLQLLVSLLQLVLVSSTCPALSSTSFGRFFPSIRHTLLWMLCVHSFIPSWKTNSTWEHFCDNKLTSAGVYLITNLQTGLHVLCAGSASSHWQQQVHMERTRHHAPRGTHVGLVLPVCRFGCTLEDHVGLIEQTENFDFFNIYYYLEFSKKRLRAGHWPLGLWHQRFCRQFWWFWVKERPVDQWLDCKATSGEKDTFWFWDWREVWPSQWHHRLLDSTDTLRRWASPQQKPAAHRHTAKMWGESHTTRSAHNNSLVHSIRLLLGAVRSASPCRQNRW